MSEWQTEYRKQRGREIAELFRIEQKDGEWIVPSSKGGLKKYRVIVEPTNVSCTCLDHHETGGRCKHIFAVEHLLRNRPESSGCAVAPDPDLGPPSSDGASGPLRPTYKRDWRLYNDTLVNEQDEFEPLAAELCGAIVQPEHLIGRRPVPYRDAVLAAIIKVYLDLSERRVMPRLRRAYELGYLETPITLGTVAACLEKPALTPILLDLIVRSSRPLVPVETVFAADSTGLVGNRFINWRNVKYRGMLEHMWAKVHLCCGIRTHIFTTAIIGDRDASDLAQLPELLRITRQNFTIREVLADKVYNTRRNQELIAAMGATAYIPFKASHNGRLGGIWTEQFRRFHEHREEFDQHYHQRSNIEAAIMMMKSKFGDGLRSKTETAMKNEALCKVLCHNLYVLIRCVHGFGIGTGFLAACFQKKITEDADD
jgi:transposase